MELTDATPPHWLQRNVDHCQSLIADLVARLDHGELDDLNDPDVLNLSHSPRGDDPPDPPKSGSAGL